MARVTIEDCLKVIDNAFDICSLAGRRAKDLAAGAEPLVDCNDKPTVIALREIAAEKIGMDYFEISNKEKIESQLFGSGITEEEVVNELSQQLEENPSPHTADTSSVIAEIKPEEPLETKEVAIEVPVETKEVSEDPSEIKPE